MLMKNACALTVLRKKWMLRGNILYRLNKIRVWLTVDSCMWYQTTFKNQR